MPTTTVSTPEVWWPVRFRMRSIIVHEVVGNQGACALHLPLDQDHLDLGAPVTDDESSTGDQVSYCIKEHARS